MTFKEKLECGKFVLTSEIGPPKGISLDEILRDIAPFKGRVDAINVTDQQSSVMRMSALGASVILKQNGFEPILQMTCRDRNRLALQADLLSAAALGIENILALMGDPPSCGDHPDAKPVFDFDVLRLLSVIRGLEKGCDAAGGALTLPLPRFCAGAAVNPGAASLEAEVARMEQKLNSGAEFFQTQAVFDVAVFEKFLAASRHLKAKILVGIVFLKSEKMARYMNEHVPGVCVPEPLMEELRRAQDKKAVCVDIAARLIRSLDGMCAGVHLMPIGWYGLLPQVSDAAGYQR